MLISINWIKEFVNLPQIDTDDLANAFTMTTAEVEDVTKHNQHLEMIRVAQIKSITKHPEADKLNLVTFEYEAGKTKEVVCGAPNVREGLKIPYAPLGVTLPNGLTLEPKKIRGYLSEGMLCSEVELGLGEGSSGLMELPDNAPIGQFMTEYLNVEADTILDVDNKSLTHRPDLWGHLGIAREFAAAYETALKNPYTKEWEKSLEAKFSNEASPIVPKVEKDSSCKAYWGLSIDGIEVGPSPSWLISKIEACGLRSINNIVDISNYVMLELGIPLHIFDRDQIKDNTIHIKRVGSNETFKTLDEFDRKLVPTDTVICDSEKPLVLAGIMGGLNSGVTDKTSKIFIEVANWQAEEVRTTSTRLGLRTDSSQRYEKSLDSLQCYRTLLRTLELILKINPNAKVIGKAEYDGNDLSQIQSLEISITGDKIRSVLGHDVSDEKLESIFKSLEFEISKSKNAFQLKIPSFRTTKDIEYEACIIEEVGRIIGYDNIDPVSPQFDIHAVRLDSQKHLTRKVQDFLMMHNCLEVMTYPLIGKSLLEKAKWPILNTELELINSLSKDADRMRPSLIPHALQTFSVNAKQFSDFSFFEFGRSYLPGEKSFFTERHQILIGTFCKNQSPFMKLVNQTEKLLNYLKIPFSFEKENQKFPCAAVPKDWVGKHPYEYQELKIMGKSQGAIFSCHPLILKGFKVKGNAAIAVIDVTDFWAREQKDKTKYTPISKYPASSFDCTVMIDKDTELAPIVSMLQKLKIKELVDAKIVTVFPIENKNAVTFRTFFVDETKTLDPQVIKDAEQLVVSSLEKAGHPLKEG